MWVRVDYIPEFGSEDYYLYYGNSSASDVSDPSATFVFYDDFDQDTLWNVIGSDSSTAIVNFDSLTTVIQKYDECGYEGVWKGLDYPIFNFKLIARDYMPADTDPTKGSHEGHFGKGASDCMRR